MGKRLIVLVVCIVAAMLLISRGLYLRSLKDEETQPALTTQETTEKETFNVFIIPTMAVLDIIESIRFRPLQIHVTEEAVTLDNIVEVTEVETEATVASEVEVVQIPVTEPPLPVAAAAQPTQEYFPVYTVCGVTMDIWLQQYLYKQLCYYGIGWWMPYAIMQAFQESGFNVNAENVNGLDKGLFQYRTTYWEEPFDIFNPLAQIDCYCRTMANRLNKLGCSVEEAISRHNVSDWGSYNPVYVSQVLQWAPYLNQIR